MVDAEERKQWRSNAVSQGCPPARFRTGDWYALRPMDSTLTGPCHEPPSPLEPFRTLTATPPAMSADPLAAIIVALEKQQIIPDVVPWHARAFTPSVFFSIVYPNGAEVNLKETR